MMKMNTFRRRLLLADAVISAVSGMVLLVDFDTPLPRSLGAALLLSATLVLLYLAKRGVLLRAAA